MLNVRIDWKLVFMAGFVVAIILVMLGVKVFHIGPFDIEVPTVMPAQQLATPVQSSSLQPSPEPPKQTPNPNCQDFPVGYEFRESAALTETRVYTRCPIGEVEYSIQVDDTLNSIVLKCAGSEPQGISFRKNEERSRNQLLTTFDSDKFHSGPNCKVEISITNGQHKIGYTLWQEVIAQ